MKILIIGLTFPPRRFGGVTEASFNLARNLMLKGHEVTVYTTDVGNNAYSRLKVGEVENLDGLNVHYFKNISNRIAFKHQIYLPKSLRRVMKEEISRYDIIQFQDFRSLLHIVTWYYAKKFDVPYVLQTFGYLSHTFERAGLRKVFDQIFGYKIFSDAKMIISGTEDLDEYKKIGVDKGKIAGFEWSKIRVVTNPLYDVEKFKTLSDSNRFRKMFKIKEKNVIIFLGRIHKIKGIEFLLKGFAELCHKKNDVILAIIGPDEGYKTVLEHIINQLGIKDKVIFTGILNGDDKVAALNEADILVQTSIHERGPGSPFEAVLCGTPIIVTKNTGAGDIVEKINAGFLVEYGDVNSLKNG